MKKIVLLISLFSVFAVSAQTLQTERDAIARMLNDWHRAAANANSGEYFKHLDENSVYIGTDATENWNKKEFEIWAKPYFDKGKAWSFKAVERHIYFSSDRKTAWFDELLDTQMKICRGSGVVEKINGEWKIKHYVLSMTIPNNNVDEVIKIKEHEENQLLKKLQKQ